jgi:tRNA(Leu) C34 or U34 (ribose-2'-O)-methylase TrmL
MRGFSCIGLDNPKDPANVGAALRAAYAFNIAMLATSGQRYKRASTDTLSAYKHLPLVQCADLRDVVPFDCVPVAIELTDSAVPIAEYQHPERAFYVFGAEDNTLGSRVLSWCRDVVYIPTRECLNLAACVNVVLYDRAVKRGEWNKPRKLSGWTVGSAAAEHTQMADWG